MSPFFIYRLPHALPPSYIALLPYPHYPHLPVANLMEGLIGQSLYKGKGSLASSSCFTGKAPATS